MKRKKVIFERIKSSSDYRSLLKNQHGRRIYIELNVNADNIKILECWYCDRNIGKTGDKRKSAEPLLWKTKETDSNIKNLKRVLVEELDMTPFLEIDFIENIDTIFLTTEEFISHYTVDDKYRFLIMVQQKTKRGVMLETVIKNKVHRRIYVNLSLQKEKNAYILDECYYSDRTYKLNERKMPETLVNGNTKGLQREDLIQWFNEQLTCDFNAVLFVSPEDIKLDKCKAICGTL